MAEDYLQLTGVTVTFEGFTALDAVDLTVLQSDLRFLIGPNGAGKTTLIDAITGLSGCTGMIDFSGRRLDGLRIAQIVRSGVGRTFQTASLFDELTVLQNLDIAAGAGRHPLSLLRRRRGVPAELAETLELIGLVDRVDAPAGVLPHGEKRWLEIGMLLAQRSRLLLLDEPVAGMSAAEKENTGALLHRIAEDRTVIIVEHDMDFMRAFAKSVSVLAQGRVLAEGSVAEVQANREVQQIYLGSLQLLDDDDPSGGLESRPGPQAVPAPGGVR